MSFERLLQDNISYSYINIPGYDKVTDYDKQCEIAHDIATEIKIYMYKRSINDISIDYNVITSGDRCIFYIDGSEDVIQKILTDIDFIIRGMYTETFLTRWYKYIRTLIFS